MTEGGAVREVPWLRARSGLLALGVSLLGACGTPDAEGFSDGLHAASQPAGATGSGRLRPHTTQAPAPDPDPDPDVVVDDSDHATDISERAPEVVAPGDATEVADGGVPTTTDVGDDSDADDGELPVDGDGTSTDSAQGAAPDVLDADAPEVGVGCIDGSVCSMAANCGVGVCAGGACLDGPTTLWQVPGLSLPVSSPWIYRARPDGNGGVLLIGKHNVPGTPYPEGWVLVARFNSAGKLLWWSSPIRWTDGEVSDVTALPNGGFAVTGMEIKLGVPCAAVALLDSGGNLTKVVCNLDDGGHHYKDIAVAGDGKLVVWSQYFSKYPHLVRLDTQGGLIQSAMLVNPFDPTNSTALYFLDAIGAQSNGWSYAFGRYKGAVPVEPYIVVMWRLSPTGAQTVVHFPQLAAVSGAVASSTQLYVLAHPAGPWSATAPSSSLLNLTPTGQVLWQRSVAGTYESIAFAHGDGLLLAGHLAPTLRLDPFGVPMWSTLPANFALPTPGGTLLVGPADANPLLLRRTDAWGNVDCKVSGACATMAFAACDDANPCTADTCAAGACAHVALPEATTCAVDMACTSGTCK